MVDLLVTADFIFTIMILSLLYRDNPLSRLAENIAVGAAAANALVMAYYSLLSSGIQPIRAGDYLFLIPLMLGFLVFFRFYKKGSWIARYPIALFIGIGTGLAVRTSVESMFVAPIKDLIRPLTGVSALSAFNNLVILVGTLTALAYFIFTIKETKVLGASAKIGRSFIMIALGVGFTTALGVYLGSLIGNFMNIVDFLRSLFGI